MERSSTLYYRLKMADANGRFEYSKTVRVLDENRNNEVTLSVFPNPFKENITLTFESAISGMITLNIIDLTGKTIATIIRPIAEGSNLISVVEVNELNSEVYFISINNGINTQNIKLLKQ